MYRREVLTALLAEQLDDGGGEKKSRAIETKAVKRLR